MITGIILAGGKSSRMGAEKGLVPFMGAPMISHVIGNIETICQEIIISANSHEYSSLPFTMIPDDNPNLGPAGGIITCMKKAVNDLCLVIAADMPLASSSFLKELILRSAGHDITICREGNLVQPLCGIYNTTILPEFGDLTASGTRKLGDLIKSFRYSTIEQNDMPGFPFQYYLSNINSAKELVTHENPRVFILTGPKNGGKSRYLREMIDYFKLSRIRFGGIGTQPVFDNNIKTGYNLEDLENGNKKLLCKDSPESGWIASGKFYFNPEALDYGINQLTSAANRQLPSALYQLIILDELGPLELQGGGWWPGINRLLKSPIQKLIIVVREELMLEAWNLFKDHHVHIIQINDPVSPEDKARQVLR